MVTVYVKISDDWVLKPQNPFVTSSTEPETLNPNPCGSISYS